MDSRGWVKIKPGAKVRPFTLAAKEEDKEALHFLLKSVLPPLDELPKDVSGMVGQITSPHQNVDVLPIEWHTTFIPVSKLLEAIMRLHDQIVVLHPNASTTLYVLSKVSFEGGWQSGFHRSSLLMLFLMRRLKISPLFSDDARGLILFLRIVSCHRVDLAKKFFGRYTARDVAMLIKDVCPLLLQEFFCAYFSRGVEAIAKLRIEELYP